MLFLPNIILILEWLKLLDAKSLCNYVACLPSEMAKMTISSAQLLYLFHPSGHGQHGHVTDGQYHSGAVSQTVGNTTNAVQKAVPMRPQSNFITMPLNRSHNSPQPGGYPGQGRSSQMESMLRTRHGGNVKSSPQTPSSMMTSTQQSHNSPGYVSNRGESISINLT